MYDIETLIADNVYLINIYLSKFNKLHDQDAESDCYMALYKAALTYDNTKNIKFVTYASSCIYNALAMIERRSKVKYTDIPIVHLDAEVKDNNSRAAPKTVADILVTNNSIEDIMRTHEKQDMINTAIQRCSAEFNGSYRVIVDAWIDSDCSLKQAELAKIANVSQSHVSRTLCRFKNLMRLELNKLEEEQ